MQRLSRFALFSVLADVALREPSGVNNLLGHHT